MISAKARYLPILLALLFAEPSSARAHGGGWQVDDGHAPKNYRFAYTDGTAMAFAEVTVTGPDGQIWQKANTDRTGHFAFGPDHDAIPDTPDKNRPVDKGWHIKVSDGMGHVVQLTHQPHAETSGSALALASETASASPSPTSPAETRLRGTSALVDLPVWASILLGLSLLANLFGGMLWWRQRK